jgi:tetratricopeptide (TPR) repeat protein
LVKPDRQKEITPKGNSDRYYDKYGAIAIDPCASDKELLQKAEKEKADGNASVAANDFNEARWHYRRALDCIKEMENKNVAEKLKLICLTNSAIMFNKLEKWQNAVTYCNEALKIDDKHVKALYQRSLAY